MPTTPYMGLTLPTVSVTLGPEWATELNEAFDLVDEHDHTTGKGVPIRTDAIDIDDDLDFNGFSAIGLESVQLEDQASFATANSLYAISGNPIWNNGAGSPLRLVNVSFPMVIGDLIYASSTTAFGKLAIGSNGQVLKVSAGLPAWQANTIGFVTEAKTGSFSASASVDLYTCSGAAITATLPSATGSGKVFYFKKTDASLANIITIDAGAGSIVDYASATTTTLNTIGEEVTLVDTATNTWQLVARRIPSFWSSDLTFTAPEFGTLTSVSSLSKREGDSIRVRFKFIGDSLSGNTAYVGFPSGIALDTAKVASGIVAHVGFWNEITTAGAPDGIDYSAAESAGVHFVDTSATDRVFFGVNTISAVFQKAVATSVSTNNFPIVTEFLIPVSGWNG